MPILALPWKCFVTSKKHLEVSEPRKQTGRGPGFQARLIYSVVLISAVHQSDLVMREHTYAHMYSFSYSSPSYGKDT